jgi:phosphoribosylanthranilate isomerase
LLPPLPPPFRSVTLWVMMVKVKICGITSATDALMAATAGADAIGLNFYQASPRYIDPDRALAIRIAMPPFVAAVGIFVDEEPERVREIMDHCHLDYAQLHGRETPRTVARLKGCRVIKAIRIRSEEDLREIERYRVDAFLLDTYVKGEPGGTGRTFDWDLARAAANRAKVILAGGLTPDNVAQAVAAGRPYGVDVASGVESEPGKKNRKLVNRFLREAKGVEL